MIAFLRLELVLNGQQVGDGLMAAGLAAQQHAADLVRIARLAVAANRLILRGGDLDTHNGPLYMYTEAGLLPAGLSPGPSPEREGESVCATNLSPGPSPPRGGETAFSRFPPSRGGKGGRGVRLRPYRNPP